MTERSCEFRLAFGNLDLKSDLNQVDSFLPLKVNMPVKMYFNWIHDAFMLHVKTIAK